MREGVFGACGGSWVREGVLDYVLTFCSPRTYVFTQGIPWCTKFEICITSSRPVRLSIDTIPNRSQLKPSAPATTSMISWVISACRARFISSVRSVMISPAFSDALRIAVICAPKNPAADSTSAR